MLCCSFQKECIEQTSTVLKEKFLFRNINDPQYQLINVEQHIRKFRTESLKFPFLINGNFSLY